MGGKQRGRLLHGVSCPQGPTPLPLGWGLSSRGAGCFRLSPSHSHGAPHPSAAVSEPAWPPAASPLCRAAAERRQTPDPLPHRRSWAGSVGENGGTVTLPGIHPPGASSCQDTLPRCCSGAEEGLCLPLPIRLHLLHPRDCTMACRASQLRHRAGRGCSPAVHTHTHVCVHTPAQRLPSHSEADCGGLRVIHETPEIRSHGKGCGFPGRSSGRDRCWPMRGASLGQGQDLGTRWGRGTSACHDCLRPYLRGQHKLSPVSPWQVRAMWQ